MTESIGWHHPSDDSDQWDGFNDSGIEHFRGNPIFHLAREVCQNALDAAKDSGTVVVRFTLQEIETSTIPDLNELRENLVCCLDAARDESQKARIFFENAIETLGKKKCSVLVISDFNTQGMKGPSVNGTPFYAFVKAKGQSKKSSETAAGSYGIGKYAPYAVSNIRTIFISTVYQDDGKGQWSQLTQGKSIVMSHEKGGKRKQGVGFWGVRNKCQPVLGVDPKIPGWLQRADTSIELQKYEGSKISIICFDAIKNWEDYLAISVVENFFGAINDGNLKVVIGDNHFVDKETAAQFLDNNELKKLISKQNNEPEHFQNCKNYLATLQDDSANVEESEMRELGLCRVRIMVGEGLPRKVCALRRGMFINDNLNRLKSFSDFKEFAAVVQCVSSKGNELLRAMEPPRHDDFEPSRLPTKDDQKRGARALLDLAKWIREMLKRHAKDPVSEVTELDELKDFFGDEDGDGSGKGVEEINPYGKILIQAKPIKVKVYSSPQPDGDEEDDEGEGDGGGGGGGGSGSGGGGGTGGKGGSKGGVGKGLQKPAVDLSDVRAIVSSNNRRKIAFTPTRTGKFRVRLLEAGDDSDYPVDVVRSDCGYIKDGSVILDMTAGARYSLNIELSENFSGAIKVVANEI